MDEIMARAFRAYYMMAKREPGAITDHPSNDSDVQKVNSKEYAVLRNCNGILAVYRVRNDGMLKRLKRWPQALESY